MSLAKFQTQCQEIIVDRGVRSLPVCILTSDFSGVVIAANDEAVRVFGEAVIGKHASDVYSSVEGIDSFSPTQVRRALDDSKEGVLSEVVVAVMTVGGERRLMAATFYKEDAHGVSGVLMPLSITRLPIRLDPIQRLARGDDPSHVLQLIVDQALKLSGADGAFLRTIAPRGHLLELVAESGERLLRDDMLSSSEGVLASVLDECELKRVEITSHCRPQPVDGDAPLYGILVPVLASSTTLGEGDSLKAPIGILGVVSKRSEFMSHHEEILLHFAATVSLALAWRQFIGDMKAGYSAVMSYHVDAAGMEMIHNAKNLLRGATDKLSEIERQLREKAFTGRYADMVRDASFDLKNMHIVLRRSLPRSQRAEEDVESRVGLAATARAAINLLTDHDYVHVELQKPSAETFVLARQSVLLFVLYNLLNNSVRAISSKRHGSQVIVQIGVHPSTSDRARVTIRDDGPGIPKEVLDDIRAGRSVSRDSGGTGLGLPSVIDAIENELHGVFDITSRLFHGTTCYVDIPVAEKRL